MLEPVKQDFLAALSASGYRLCEEWFTPPEGQPWGEVWAHNYRRGKHALRLHTAECMIFLNSTDVIALQRHAPLRDFLSGCQYTSSVSGHNRYFRTDAEYLHFDGHLLLRCVFDSDSGVCLPSSGPGYLSEWIGSRDAAEYDSYERLLYWASFERFEGTFDDYLSMLLERNFS